MKRRWLWTDDNNDNNDDENPRQQDAKYRFIDATLRYERSRARKKIRQRFSSINMKAISMDISKSFLTRRRLVIIHVKSFVDESEIYVCDGWNGAGRQIAGVLQLVRGTVGDGSYRVQRLRIVKSQSGVNDGHREKRRHCPRTKTFSVFKWNSQFLFYNTSLIFFPNLIQAIIATPLSGITITSTMPMSNTLSPEFRLNPIYRKLPCLKACDITLISIFHLNVLMLTHEDGSGKRPMFLWPVSETDRIEGLFGNQGPNQINDD